MLREGQNEVFTTSEHSAAVNWRVYRNWITSWRTKIRQATTVNRGQSAGRFWSHNSRSGQVHSQIVTANGSLRFISLDRAWETTASGSVQLHLHQYICTNISTTASGPVQLHLHQYNCIRSSQYNCTYISTFAQASVHLCRNVKNMTAARVRNCTGNLETSYR